MYILYFNHEYNDGKTQYISISNNLEDARADFIDAVTNLISNRRWLQQHFSNSPGEIIDVFTEFNFLYDDGDDVIKIKILHNDNDDNTYYLD